MKVPATVLRSLTQAAAEHTVDLHLLAAIVAQESGFRPLAIGDLDCGVALGLGQQNLRGAGADWRGDPSALLDPLTNARASAAYLHACLGAYPGEVDRAIAAYNAGIGGVSGSGWRTVNPGYVQAVRGYLARIDAEGLEETWDEEVSEGYREWGKTWLEVSATLLGVANDALTRLRNIRSFVDGQAGGL